MKFYTFILLILFAQNLFAKELITPIPKTIKYDTNKALLGQNLFNDTRLSHDNTISCASCHIIKDGGDDNTQFSTGMDGKLGGRNSPTVLNTRYNLAQFWDGRAKNLEEQVSGPINNPVEMHSNYKEVLSKLKKDKTYIKQFNNIYKDGITQENIKNSISEYEKTLITPNSKFDKYLRGDTNILTKDEKDGFILFKNYGCISCHNGVNIGGNIIQKIGISKVFDKNDLGVYNLTKNEKDKYYFKVPTLRNIALTSPYFHNGSVNTLYDAVLKMSIYQVGFELEKKDIDLIVKFLNTLTGEIPKTIKGKK